MFDDILGPRIPTEKPLKEENPCAEVKLPKVQAVQSPKVQSPRINLAAAPINKDRDRDDDCGDECDGSCGCKDSDPDEDDLSEICEHCGETLEDCGETLEDCDCEELIKSDVWDTSKNDDCDCDGCGC